jgi:hypothetical protein
MLIFIILFIASIGVYCLYIPEFETGAKVFTSAIALVLIALFGSHLKQIR